jgi:hypothetical protein
MPTNKKEGIIFTTLMCFLMVIGMSAYNLMIHNSFSLSELAKGFLPGFIVAFILDVFIVGVVAKKIAYKLPVKKDKPLYMILTISGLMVFGMVTFMSIFGIVMESHALSPSLYLQTWKMNFIAALPYQLLIVGPFSRFVLGTIQNNTPVQENSR